MRGLNGSRSRIALIGLVPATYHSGDREAYGASTQRGSGELRAMLCEAAHHASRPQHPLNPYVAKLCAKRGYKMAALAGGRRKNLTYQLMGLRPTCDGMKIPSPRETALWYRPHRGTRDRRSVSDWCHGACPYHDRDGARHLEVLPPVRRGARGG
jgi:hypothetical protein